MAEMPEIVMPDQSAPTYPAAFRFSPAVESYYRRLPRTLRRNWDLFGAGSVAEVPQKKAVRTVEGVERAHIGSYVAHATQLDRRFRDLQEMDRRVAEQVRKSLNATDKGRADLESIVHRTNADAGRVPIGMSKGEHILQYLSTGLDQVDTVVDGTTRSLYFQVDVINRLAGHLTELAQRPIPTSNLLPQPEMGREPAVGTGRPQVRTGTPESGVTARPGSREHHDTARAQPLATSRTPGIVLRATTQPPVPKSDPDSTSSDSPSRVISETAALPSGDPTATSLFSTFGHDPKTRGIDHAAPATSARATGAATPWSHRSGSVPSPGRPHVASTANRGSGGSEISRKSSAHERVTYVFPDGRTQEVSPMVARALDAAFGNRLGTDARSAYAASRVVVPSDDSSAIRRDPRSVATGDIAVWSRRTAVLVVFGTGGDRTYEAIIDGRLRSLSGRMVDSRGGFGSFIGFYRPRPAGRDIGTTGEPGALGGPRAVDAARSRTTAVTAATTEVPRVQLPDSLEVVDTPTPPEERIGMVAQSPTGRPSA